MKAPSRLTATAQSALKKCLRLYYYRYELGLSRIRQAEPLRFGKVFHHGLELFNTGADKDLAIQTAIESYSEKPEWADPTDWAVEQETLKALLCGHFWRYERDNVEFVSVEQTFDIPLVNPDSGAVSRKFSLAGKMDGIVKLPDGRLAVLEYKTAGEDIAPDSEYWQRLRCDAQISVYVLAARALGYEVATVLYDVTRKPTIRLRQNETPQQYGQRLLEDLGERPDYYFQRREIPRLEDDLSACRAELWQQAQQLMEVRRRSARLVNPASAWFRNVSRLSCSQCEFSGLCLNGLCVRPGDPAPTGYQILSDVNPELAVTGE